MERWRNDDPFQLDLTEQRQRTWPVRDSTSGMATQNHLEDRPDVLQEFKLLSVAAVIGMSLAVGAVFALRATTSPDPQAQAVAEPRTEAVAAASPEPAGAPEPVADEAPPPADEAASPPADPAEPAAPPMVPLRSDLAEIAAAAGAAADRAASEAAPEIAERRTEARAAAAEAREAARAAAEEAAEEADDEDDLDEDDDDPESVHAASGDDIIDLDDTDPDDDANADASWSEVQARYDALRGSRSDDGDTKKKHKKKRSKRRRAKKADKKAEPKAVAKEETKAAEPAGPAGAFDRDAATSAMFAAAGGAAGCATENGPSGRGRVSVTLSPSGRVSSVDVGAPFAGTKTGSCIASMFRSISVPPFTGGAIALQKSFTVPVRSAAKSDDEPNEPSKRASKPVSKKPKKKKKKPAKRASGRRRGRARR